MDGIDRTMGRWIDKDGWVEWDLVSGDKETSGGGVLVGSACPYNVQSPHNHALHLVTHAPVRVTLTLQLHAWAAYMAGIAHVAIRCVHGHDLSLPPVDTLQRDMNRGDWQLSLGFPFSFLSTKTGSLATGRFVPDRKVT